MFPTPLTRSHKCDPAAPIRRRGETGSQGDERNSREVQSQQKGARSCRTARSAAEQCASALFFSRLTRQSSDPTDSGVGQPRYFVL